MVKIPAGIQKDMKIRLKGMGLKKGDQQGDLYLQVKIKN
jgi:DnaJ-class molecular chaperone